MESKNITTTESKKTWSLARNELTLNFTLRTDIKKELVDFKDMLEEAIRRIDKEIEIWHTLPK